MAFQITLTNFINDILNVVDEVTAEFIQSGYRAIASHWITSGLLTSILTLYIMNFFYQVKYHELPLKEATPHLFKVCFVFALATNWDVFYILIFNVVTNEPIAISNALLSRATNSDGSLNGVFIEGMKLAFDLLKNIPISPVGGFLTIVGAALIVAATVLFTILAVGLIVISKFYLAVLLALAPYFIIAYLFNGSKGLTESWAKDVINKALIPVFVGAVMLLTSTLAKACLFASRASLGSSAPDFASIITYFLCGLISLFLFKIIPEKTASLTASLAIAAPGKMASQAAQSLSKGGAAAKALGRGVGKASSDFKQRQQQLMSEVRGRARERAEKAQEARNARARSGY